MNETIETTHDTFLKGAVSVCQPKQGYRAGMDAVLLAASLEASGGQMLAEAGCGAGAALFCAASRLNACSFSGFERDIEMAALARKGVELNKFEGRVAIHDADITARPRELENSFDQAFANPPFFAPGSVRAPGAGKEGAYLAETALKDWILFLHHVTKPGGRMTMIHRAAALADILEALNRRSGEIEILPIRPAPGEAAKRVLVRARKGLRKGEVKLHDGLVLHREVGGTLTDRAASIMAGDALVWR